MATELEELRARSTELADRLGADDALETNAAILDLAPGDPVATNRLGIGLLNAARPAEAIAVLETGLRIHPKNAIMAGRLKLARKAASEGQRPATGTRPRRGARLVTYSGPWTDFEPAELVERCLHGPGRDACIRLCAASILASEAIDKLRTAVTPIKQGRRFRTIGGIFTGVAPWHATLTVAVPVTRHGLIAKAKAVGGFAFEPARAVPCLQLAIPRERVAEIYDELLAAHREHLHLSLAAGAPTHLNKHHDELRGYLLDQAAKL
jgi:hypothetical protein